MQIIYWFAINHHYQPPPPPPKSVNKQQMDDAIYLIPVQCNCNSWLYFIIAIRADIDVVAADNANKRIGIHLMLTRQIHISTINLHLFANTEGKVYYTYVTRSEFISVNYIIIILIYPTLLWGVAHHSVVVTISPL